MASLYAPGSVVTVRAILLRYGALVLFGVNPLQEVTFAVPGAALASRT